MVNVKFVARIVEVTPFTVANVESGFMRNVAMCNVVMCNFL